MRYSDMVTLIKKSTMVELKSALREMQNSKICVRSTGTTRTCYLFDGFVIKMQQYDTDSANKQEFINYCNYITKQNTLYPVVRTRMYQTVDSHIILIQERVTDILDDCSSEFRNNADYNNLPQEVEHLINSDLVEFDGLQMGRNKRGKYVFFDIPFDLDTELG